MARLKVYRTAIGFHDAYVAAPSKKAALAAWGSTRDLFARGMAEVVDDPALGAAPLATPGEVVRLSRGTRDEQIAALPKATARAKRAKGVDPGSDGKAAVRKVVPKPDRRALDEAEAALAAAERGHADEAERLQARIRKLEGAYRALRKAQAAEIATLDEKRAAADRAYREAVARSAE